MGLSGTSEVRRKMFQIWDMGFGEKVEALREDRGISVRETARRVGVTANTVGRWIAGAVQPRLDEAARVAEFFGVPLAYLAYEQTAEIAGKLADDESAVIRTYRSLKRRQKIDEDRAIEGLMIAAKIPAPAKPRNPGRSVVSPVEGELQPPGFREPKKPGSPAVPQRPAGTPRKKRPG
jgi:transcriptional regulator with XRE-family HTH domain